MGTPSEHLFTVEFGCLAEAPTPLLNLADAMTVRALLNDAIDLARARPEVQVDISYAELAAIASTVAVMNMLLEELRHHTAEHSFTVEVRTIDPALLALDSIVGILLHGWGACVLVWCEFLSSHGKSKCE